MEYFTNISNTLSVEGVVLLFNVFFQPVVVAAQGVTRQISSAMVAFVSNIRVAVNPQITKLYASNDYEGSKKLTLLSAEFVFYLLLLLGVPCIILMPKLLDVWLVDVPDYAVAFSRLIVLQNILDNFNAAFYTPMTAANKIKKNSIAAALICFGQFVLLFILFKLDFGPLWARYMGIITCVLFSYIVKPYILCKDLNYTLEELYSCIFRSLKIAFIIGSISCGLYFFIPQDSLLDIIAIGVLSVLIVIVTILVCMEKNIRKSVLDIIYKKCTHRAAS